LDLLRPPPGYELDRAVGTTFTLDLETALVLPLAFASYRLARSNDPIALMEAVRSAASRVDLFCQAGQMVVPQRASGLFAFLEPMVHEVRRPNPGRLFHPKLWYLRFIADGADPAVRLLVLTRNLTDSSSWDLGLRLDGLETGRPRAANRPLADLLRALPTMATQPPGVERIDGIDRLADSVRRVEWELPEHVKDQPSFFVYGLPAVKERPEFHGYRHLVVAPFLTDGGLANVVPSDSDVTVVSRVEELDRLESDTLKQIGKTLVVGAAADLGDPDDSDDPGDPGDAESAAGAAERSRLVGLHAKLYVVERNRAAHLFIGSANATDAAFDGNVGLLVELKGGASKLGVDQMLRSESGFGAILEEYAPEGGADDDPTEQAIWALQQALQTLGELSWTVTVRLDGSSYAVHVSAPGSQIPGGVTITVELLTRRGTTLVVGNGEPVDGVLGPVDLDEVSPFLVVTASMDSPDGTVLRRSSVVRAHLVNDPEGRLDEILARQVDTPEKFLRFLLLILGLGDVASVVAAGDGDDDTGPGAWSMGLRSNGLFELLARAVADQPSVLDTLDSLVPRMRASETGRQALPPGFDELWSVIEAARPELDALREVAGS
jgi:hypothetical protein